MDQMVWREQVGDARAEKDLTTLKTLETDTAGAIRAAYDDVARALDEHADKNIAVEGVRRLMFLEKLHEEIDNAIFDLEDL